MRTPMGRAAVALIGAAAMWFGCEGPAAHEPTGRVRGAVVDGLTEAPLSGVHVRTRDGRVSAVTDANGRFELALPAGTHRLWLDREGYVGGQRAYVRVGAAAVTEIDPHLFPVDPDDATIDAYFARQPVRRHAHPAHERPTREALPDDVGVVRAAESHLLLPDTIRVWRAGGTALEPTRANGFADNSCHPDAVVLELPREEYVKGVIPHEWFPSWHPEALRAGAISARTYAVRWANRGGRWDCADVDDGTVTQVYRDDRSATTNAAVDATAGQVVVRDGAIVNAEYSAENADPTEFGVDEPTCTGEARFGHGRGMCQWGTHRWASAICANPPCDWSAFGGDPPTARDHVWMVEHYFPGATVDGEGVDTPPCAVIPAAGGVLDDAGPCFDAYGPSEFWRTEASGWDGGLRWTNAFMASAPSNWAQWELNFAAPGRYEVEVYVDETWGVYDRARYEVFHDGGSDEVRIDQGSASGWVSLGTYAFGDSGSVQLLDHEATAVPADQHIVADAIRLTPEGGPPPGDGGVVGMDGGPSTGPGARQVPGLAIERSGGGLDGGGCAAGARGGPPTIWAGLALALLLVRRRRR